MMTPMMTPMMTWMTTDGCARAGGVGDGADADADDGVVVGGVVGVVRRTAVAPRRDAREGVAVVGRPRWCVITRRTYARVDRTCAHVRWYRTRVRVFVRIGACDLRFARARACGTRWIVGSSDRRFGVGCANFEFATRRVDACVGFW